MSLQNENQWDKALLQFKQRLDNYNYEQDPRQNLIHLATTITEACEAAGIPAPIVVGGLAVELYTKGNYTTRDVDLITELGPSVYRVMLALGFTYESEHGYFTYPKLRAIVEFPEPPLAGDEERVLRLVFGDGSYAYVLSIEDTILGRLEEFVYWDRSKPGSASATQLMNLFRVHYEDLDHDYLRTESAKRRVEDALNYFLKELNK